MRDRDIRDILVKSLKTKCKKNGKTILIEELGLCQGISRVDVAVINGALHGYEIKSERDSLKRLPVQQEFYSKIFDYVTIVASTRHIQKIKNNIPLWWGLLEAQYRNDELVLKKIRSEKKNNSVNPQFLVQLLWKDEALNILKARNMHRGVLSKTREAIWNRLVDRLSIEELRREVRKKIKERKFWRSGQKQM